MEFLNKMIFGKYTRKILFLTLLLSITFLVFGCTSSDQKIKTSSDGTNNRKQEISKEEKAKPKKDKDFKKKKDKAVKEKSFEKEQKAASKDTTNQKNNEEKGQWIAQKLEEFTFYTNPAWEKGNETIFFKPDGSEVYGITGISNLGSGGSELFFKNTIEHIKKEGEVEIIKTSDTLTEKKNKQGVTYYVGWVDSRLKNRPQYSVFLLVPQKNLVVSFVAQFAKDSISRDEVYETMENMYQDIEFHLGERDYVSGNTFIVGEDAEICFYKDNTFKFYRSKDDHENDYFEGTYEVLYGEAAIDKVVSMKDYGLTREEMEKVLAAQMDQNVSLSKNNLYRYWAEEQKKQGKKVEEIERETHKVCRDTFHAIILHNETLVKSPTESEKLGIDTLYFGHYINEKETMDLVNANAGSYALWKFSKITE